MFCDICENRALDHCLYSKSDHHLTFQSAYGFMALSWCVSKRHLTSAHVSSQLSALDAGGLYTFPTADHVDKIIVLGRSILLTDVEFKVWP